MGTKEYGDVKAKGKIGICKHKDTGKFGYMGTQGLLGIQGPVNKKK